MKQDASFILGCPECETRYEIPVAIPEGGRKVRCAKCSHVWEAQAGDEMPLSEFLKFHQDEEVEVVFANPEAKTEADSEPEQEAAAEAESGSPDTDEPASEPEAGAEAETADEGETASTAESEDEASPASEAESDPASGSGPPDEEILAGLEADEDSDTVAAFYGDKVPASDKEAEAQSNTEAEPAIEAEPEAEPEAAPNAAPEPELQAEPAPETEPEPEPEAPPESEPEAEPGDEAESLDEEELAKEFESALEAGTESEPEEIVVGKGRRRRQLPANAAGLAAGWGMLCLVLFGLGYLTTSQRAAVVRALPGTAWVYEALGLPVNLRGLDFRSIDYTWETESGRVVLQVHGDIVNISGRQLDVPGIVFALRDENETEVYKWEDEVLHEPLAAGERATFAVRIPTPPKSIKSVQVRFAKSR